MTEPAAAWSRALGGDPAAHRSRYLTPRVLRDADLVLGMAREHRREVVGLTPALTKTTFTLRELARLTAAVDGDELVAAAEGAGTDPRDRLRALFGLLGRRRGSAPPVDPAADDVADPIGRALEVYEQSARQVEDALPRCSGCCGWRPGRARPDGSLLGENVPQIARLDFVMSKTTLYATAVTVFLTGP